MKSFFHICLAIFLPSYLLAQSTVDSLIYHFERSSKVETKLHLLNQITAHLIAHQAPNVINFAKEALELSENVNNSDEKAKALENLGLIYWYHGDYADALSLFLDLLKVADQAKQEELKALAFLRLGQVYLRINRVEEALRHYHKALVWAEEQRNISLKVKLKICLGEAYHQDNNTSKALKNLFEALKANSQSVDTASLAGAYLAIAKIYLDSGEWNRALSYLNQAREIFLDINRPYDLMRCTHQLGLIHLRQSQPQLAEPLFKEALASAQEMHAKKEISQISQNLSTCYEMMEDLTQALRYYQLHQSYQDSVYSEINLVLLADLQSSYELRNKDHEIELLRSNQANLQNKLRKSATRRYFLSIWAVLASFGVIFLIYAYWQKNQNNRFLIRQNEEQNAQKEAINAQKDQLRALNDEKNLMIKNVAHDLKAPLNRIYGLAELLHMEDKQFNQEQKKYINLISQITYDARTMIQNWLDIKTIEEKQLRMHIAKVDLDELLQDLLVGYKEQAAKKGIRVYYQNFSRELFIYTDSSLLSRILDNLISNAVKFSPLNKSVYIKLYQNEHEVCIAVQDEGIGISEQEQTKLFKKFQRLSARPTASESSTGLGLSIVKTLAAYLQARILVDSEVGRGSTFTLVLPYELNSSSQREA